MKTICLTGMMGSGKSTVAKLFAQKFGFEVVDIDALIEQNERMSISEIFALKGEEYFREIEKKTILKVFNLEDKIIALGGGAFENYEIRDFLLKNSYVVYLKTSPQVIFNRIKEDTSRPLLCGNMSVEKIEEIIKKREGNYKSAHKVILTDNKTQDEIVMELSND